MFASNKINNVVNGYITVTVMVLFIAFSSLPVAASAAVEIALSTLFLHLLERRSRMNATLHQKAQDDMAESSVEYLRGMPGVKSFKQEGAAEDGVRRAYHDSKEINIQIEKEYMPYNCPHLFSLRTASVGLVAAAAYRTLCGNLDVATLLMISMFFTIFRSIEPLNNAAHMLKIIDATLDKLEPLDWLKSFTQMEKK